MFSGQFLQFLIGLSSPMLYPLISPLFTFLLSQLQHLFSSTFNTFFKLALNCHSNFGLQLWSHSFFYFLNHAFIAHYLFHCLLNEISFLLLIHSSYLISTLFFENIYFLSHIS